MPCHAVRPVGESGAAAAPGPHELALLAGQGELQASLKRRLLSGVVEGPVIRDFCDAGFPNVETRINQTITDTLIFNEWAKTVSATSDESVCIVDFTDYQSYPSPPFDPCRAEGIIVYSVILVYMFAGLAIVCDEFFVPALEVMVERFELSNDVAGATLMAAGGSAPELFTSIIGTFLSRSNVGFGTIVGSAVFNVLFVIGMCALFSKEVLTLTWWPLARDSSFYAISLSVLALVYSNQHQEIGPNTTSTYILWWEACLLLGMYALYVTIMKFNHRLQAVAERFLNRNCRKGAAPITSAQVIPESALPTSPDGEHRVHGPNEVYKARRHSNPFGRPNQFRSGLLHLMLKEGNVLDHARFHLISGVRGDVRETFNRLDLNLSGHIELEEMQQVLRDLTGSEPTKEEVNRVFEDLEVDPAVGIDLETFTSWYVQSEHRILAEAHRFFKIMDTSGDNHLDREEIAAVIQSMQKDRGTPPYTEEDIDKALEEFQVDENGKVSEEVFLKWFRKSMLWQDVLEEVTSCEEDGGPLELEWPSSWSGRAFFILTAPIVIPLWLTIPDVRREGRENLYPITWGLSITWIAAYSYVMVFMAVLLGDAIGVPPSVMGTTFLAAGTSIPDLITSVIVARQGFGDMAVSSSIGSNIFDILIGLPIPWLFYDLIHPNAPVEVVGTDLLWSVVILIAMLLSVIITIAVNGWKMTKTLGISMFILYIVFLGQDLYRQSQGC
ncbi:Sodium/potassium/calcium exchanger 2 [Hondaea fermentalgiana]|uniref:Sodium/potassium/calcium exchanger 2 n=1 Tax=Hondaea fermentalgiana TaxID=2315210 RepID=A0A2R5GNA1_9STRA|nr:Sodium/potassium/calcium exchanger 2 [Hondaea fermentalgiana]|eukprot:GBG29781.1 Sodium/potassium/calcium exchanger 2 [Hondaea fermentalgiana]